MSQSLFTEADRLEGDGQAEHALAAWRELAMSSPTRNVFLRLGGCAQDLGHIDEAERAFTRALEIDNHSVLALTKLGSLAIHRQNYEAAECFLKRACAVEEDPARLSLLGVALMNLGKAVDAEEAYRSAIRLDSNYEEAHYNLGVLLRDDRPSEAQAHFRKALELDPIYACAHRELGWVLHKHGAGAEAVGHLRRAIELDPSDAWAHIYLGSHLWGADAASAIAEFHQALQLQPDWAVPLWSLGNIHEFVIGDLALAQSFFERALQIEPDNVVTLTNFGRLCKKRGQIDLATSYLERALCVDPHSEKARDLLADITSGNSI